MESELLGKFEKVKKGAEPFIRSYGLSWEYLERFSEEHALGAKHLIYGKKFFGIPTILGHPRYEDIKPLRPLTLLDNGCGVGTNSRFAVFDGLSAQNLIGIDIDRSMIELGYELFRDKEALKGNFIEGDSRKLSRYFPTSHFTVVYSGLLFHKMESEEDVTKVLEESRKVLKHDGMHFGMTVGTHLTNARPQVKISDGRRYLALSENKLQELLKSAGYGELWLDHFVTDEAKGESIILFYGKRS